MGDPLAIQRLQIADESSPGFAELLLLRREGSLGRRRLALTRLALAARDELQPRLERLQAALRNEPFDSSDLRAATHYALLIRLLLRYEGELGRLSQGGAAGGQDVEVSPSAPARQGPKWVGDLRLDLGRLESLLPRLRSLQRRRDPSWVSDEVDEGALGRAALAPKRAEALKQLRAFGGREGSRGLASFALSFEKTRARELGDEPTADLSPKAMP